MKLSTPFVLLMWFGVAPAAAQSTPPAVPTVVTRGEAIVRRAPDRAYVTLAVETRAKTPREATARNAQLMTSVQQKLRGLGLEAEAVQTRGYQLNPEFDFTDGRQVPRGYAARNEIEVRVDRLEQVGEIIDTAVAAGATSAGSVRFDLRDRDAVEREALKRAVADARARADAAASGAGLSVTRIVKIEEGGRGEFPPPMPYMRATAELKQAMPTPIEPGEIEIRASVTLTAEVK